MRTVRKKLLLGGVAMLLMNTALRGQARTPFAEVDLATTYAPERSNLTPGNTFWRQGGSIELSTRSGHGLGAAMNIGGAATTNILNRGVNLYTLTTTFGPRYTWTPRTGKIAFFGQGLIGESHAWDSLFPQPGKPASSYNTFAVQVGGGVDVPLSHHIALRIVQCDWIRTQFPNATTNVQNDLRLGAGLVLRLPQHRN